MMRTDGLLNQGMTRLAQVTDGLSQTIAVIEDARPDLRRFLSEYSEAYVLPVLTMTRPVPPGQRRFCDGPNRTARSSPRQSSTTRGLPATRTASIPDRARARAAATGPTTRSSGFTRAASTPFSATARSDSSRRA